MILDTEDKDVKALHIPAGYTLENTLIYVVVQKFLYDKFFLSTKEGNIEVGKLKNELGALLMSNFKYAFTKVEVTLKESTLAGEIEYVGGKPIKFELTTNK